MGTQKMPTQWTHTGMCVPGVNRSFILSASHQSDRKMSLHLDHKQADYQVHCLGDLLESTEVHHACCTCVSVCSPCRRIRYPAFSPACSWRERTQLHCCSSGHQLVVAGTQGNSERYRPGKRQGEVAAAAYAAAAGHPHVPTFRARVASSSPTKLFHTC